MSRAGRLLNTSAEVWRETRTPDGGGGWETTWVQVSTERARFSQPFARDRVLADQSQSQLTHTVYMRPAAEVRRGDQLRRAGQVFDVLAVFEPSVSGTYLRADCEARQPTN